MPGDNCAVSSCSNSRATPGVALLGMPEDDDECNVNWRATLRRQLNHFASLVKWLSARL